MTKTMTFTVKEMTYLKKRLAKLSIQSIKVMGEINIIRDELDQMMFCGTDADYDNYD